MQAVIPVPTIAEMPNLEAPLCGIPMLRRVLATAERAGATRILLVFPPGWPLAWVKRMVAWPVIESLFIDAVEIPQPFDPGNHEHWLAIADSLEDRFLWLPRNYLPHRAPLTLLLATAASRPHAAVRFSSSTETTDAAPGFFEPLVLLKRELLARAPQLFETASAPDEPGAFVQTAARKRVEAQLVLGAGKITDGIFSSFNRRLCRPTVRWLSHTRVTPNAVSIAGLGVSVLAGLCFAHGAWLWNVAGAVLFLLSGILDEIEAILARLKFQESALGSRLGRLAGFSSYLLIFAGMAIGGFRRGNQIYLLAGAALLFGCWLSFVVISVQRKLAEPLNPPAEYSRTYLVARLFSPKRIRQSSLSTNVVWSGRVSK